MELQDTWKDKHSMLGSFIGAMAKKNRSTGKQLPVGTEVVIPTTKFSTRRLNAGV